MTAAVLILAAMLAGVLYLLPVSLRVSREHREALESRERFLESTEGGI